MSDEEESHCRLCAEITLKSSLISPEEDVAVTSMVVKKMRWINIDISTSPLLPNSICFSCFDQLERAYRFLNTVRTAQVKLQEIYIKKDVNNGKSNSSQESGKPVDIDWEEFQESKPDIKNESGEEEVQIMTVETYSTTLIDCIELDRPEIKSEPNSYDLLEDSNGFKSSDDEDKPLMAVAKKKNHKKKIKYEGLDDLISPTKDMLQFPILTWDDYTWRCGSCDALFQNVQSLRLHAVQIHSVCCVFKCNDCNKTITNFRMFIKHVQDHKNLLRYCCEFCNERFNRSTYLKKHYLRHKDEQYLMCESCGLSFDTPEDLQDHIILYAKGCKRKPEKIKGEILELNCDVCERKFKSRSNLLQHKLLHSERTRDFSCHVCGKMFFTKGTLSTHMMTHEDVKPYKCEHCSMSFRARGNLQSHISLHSGAKPFVCEHCGKSFRVKRLLKSHYIIHTDLMPFICPYCNKTFRFKTRLNLHLRQHTGAKPYNCIYCQRDFTNGSNYKKHMKRRHNVDTSKKKFLNVREENNDNSLEQS